MDDDHLSVSASEYSDPAEISKFCHSRHTWDVLSSHWATEQVHSDERCLTMIIP